MVIDQKREFVTGRKYSKMVLVEVRITEAGKFRISGPGMETLEVDLPDTELTEQEAFQVWTETI